MDDPVIAAKLKEAIAARHGCDTLLSSFICNRCAQSVRVLLPTVQRLIADAEKRAAAAALRDAADEDSVAIAPSIPGVAVLRFVKTGDLYARAAALDPAGAASGETTCPGGVVDIGPCKLPRRHHGECRP